MGLFFANENGRDRFFDISRVQFTFWFSVLFVFSWLKVQKIWCHFICQLLDPYYETGLCAWFDGRWRGTFALFNFLRATKISRTEIDFLLFLFVFCFPCIRASLKFLSYLGRYGRNLQDARMHAEILRIFSENLAFFPKMGTVNRCIRASSELATIRIIGIWLYASWAGFWINPPLLIVDRRFCLLSLSLSLSLNTYGYEQKSLCLSVRRV